MPYEAFVTDLQFAQQAGRAVQVTLLNGKDLGLVGVHDVNPAEGWVSFLTPKTFGDETSRTRVDLDILATVEVSDVEWS